MPAWQKDWQLKPVNLGDVILVYHRIY